MSYGELNLDFLKNMTVLYVEDDLDVQEQLVRYLRRRVGELLIASNGAEALSIYRQQRPDIIVTDIMMPVMDGLALAAEIRKTDTSIPIILTTAFENSNYFMRSIEIGVDRYVTKPIDIELLNAALQKSAVRIRADQEVRLASKVFDNSVEAILITDSDNKICWINPAFTATTGYQLDEVIGKNPSILSSGRHDQLFYQQLWLEVEQNASWKGEIWNRRKNGEIFPEWLSISVLSDNLGKPTHYVGIFSDISERKASEEKIKHLAHHDPLTGLPNRNLLQDRIKVALAHAQRKQHTVALMMLDLDKFKQVNDSFGHQVGDALLQEVASRLHALFRASDTVCRLGGDEFVIVLNDISDVADVRRAAKNILDTITPNLLVENCVTGISPSIGIALYPQDGIDIDSLLKHADMAMYTAKRQGGNSFYFFNQDVLMN